MVANSKLRKALYEEHARVAKQGLLQENAAGAKMKLAMPSKSQCPVEAKRKIFTLVVMKKLKVKCNIETVKQQGRQQIVKRRF